MAQRPQFKLTPGKFYDVNIKSCEKQGENEYGRYYIYLITVDGEDHVYFATENAHSKLSRVVGEDVKMFKGTGDKAPIEVLLDGEAVQSDGYVKGATEPAKPRVTQEKKKKKKQEQDDYWKEKDRLVAWGHAGNVASRILAATYSNLLEDEKSLKSEYQRVTKIVYYAHKELVSEEKDGQNKIFEEAEKSVDISKKSSEKRHEEIKKNLPF